MPSRSQALGLPKGPGPWDLGPGPWALGPATSEAAKLVLRCQEIQTPKYRISFQGSAAVLRTSIFEGPKPIRDLLGTYYGPIRALIESNISPTQGPNRVKY